MVFGMREPTLSLPDRHVSVKGVALSA